MADNPRSKRKATSPMPDTGSKKQRTQSEAVLGQVQPTTPPSTKPSSRTEQLPAAPPPPLAAKEAQREPDAAPDGMEGKQPDSAPALPAYLSTKDSKVSFLKSLAGKSWTPGGTAKEPPKPQRGRRAFLEKPKSEANAAPKQAAKPGKKAVTAGKANDDDQATLPGGEQTVQPPRASFDDYLAY
ncbi:uncharacterized protein BDZ99DRAFT_279306 [Mytilinidion resinicola]|uniref:Uncharacterized protein n=1 Tax=Mytilinidion resinicola TaxID=574789 RepID=A0A6A6YSZ8_9PEZI|nr:uncharacterized protein BDZ99DRAFT_279306 [Mytilinidion resinicola]KAF2811688.1 hypothetical protein BDZ99DRAFT_279306 [Mytilinidion resinicola]